MLFALFVQNIVRNTVKFTLFAVFFHSCEFNNTKNPSILLLLL